MATTKLYLEKAKDKSGKLKVTEVSILIKVSIDRTKRFQSTTKERVSPQHWDFKTQRVKKSFKGHIELNLALDKIRVDIVQLWRDNKGVDMVSLKEMADSFIQYGQAKAPLEKKTIIEALDEMINQYSIEKDLKTKQKFSSLKTHLSNFIKKYPFDFESIDFSVYDKFKNFLYKQHNQVYPDMYLHNKGDHWIMSKIKSPYKVGLMDDTVYKYIINFKIFLTWASKRGYPVTQSYQDWPLIQREYEPISLSMKELESIEQLEITSQTVVEKLGVDECYLPVKAGIIAKALDNARDYLALECRTAQRISDLLAFDQKDVQNTSWTFTQNKGHRLKARTVTVPFRGYCAPAYWILKKHEFKLPQISNQKLNDNIKNVCKMAGLTEEISIERWIGNKKVRIIGPKYEFISTHTGRKTFITLGLQLGVPSSIVMDLSGITSERTLKKYKGPAEQSVVEQWMDKMESNLAIMRKAQ